MKASWADSKDLVLTVYFDVTRRSELKVAIAAKANNHRTMYAQPQSNGEQVRTKSGPLNQGPVYSEVKQRLVLLYREERGHKHMTDQLKSNAIAAYDLVYDFLH